MIDHDNYFHAVVEMRCEISNDNKTKCIIIIIETLVFIIQ